MAGASYPKPDGEKRNRSVPVFAWTNLPAEGRREPAPELGELNPDGRAWLERTREWWAHLWAKPQATQWDERDAELLTRVIIYDKVLRGQATASELGEARQIDDRHGLNPKSMLQLRWRIGDPEDETAVVPARARRKASERQKAALTVVDGGREHG